MSTTAPPPRAPGAVVARAAGAIPRAVTRLRRDPPQEPVSLSLCLLLSVAVLVGGLTAGLVFFPPSTYVLPLLAGGLLLRPPPLRVLFAVTAVCLVADLAVLGLAEVRPGAFASIVGTGLVAYELARSREDTGLVGTRRDNLLVELRTRLAQQGALPVLPGGWRAEAALRPAGGGPFAGDFVVSALTGGGARFELGLVDVSGKGVDAGTRALLLSGALGGLLGAVSPEHFLGAANSYLCRQDWDEGFATAVHLVLDLVDGSYALSAAGHPPAGVFDAGSGRWSLAEPAGTALGLLADQTYRAVTGRLDPGDALLLYTDGLIEVPGRDLSVGIDKLLGEAERLVSRGFAGGGEVLVNRVAAGSVDDRGLVLVWRER